MAFYEDRVLPHLINIACSTKPTRKQREKIVHLAEGDVLEIGDQVVDEIPLRVDVKRDPFLDDRLKVENLPSVNREMADKIRRADTLTLQHMDDIRRKRARHNIVALKHRQ